MLTEARQEFVIQLLSCDGGTALLPSPPTTPKAHRFQGGVIRADMLTSVDGDGLRMTVVDFSFSSPIGTINGH